MKKILLLLLVFSQAFTFAQTTPSYKNVKLTAVPLGVKNDSLVLWNGSTKLLKHLPISEIKTPTNITSIASPTNVSIISSTGTGTAIPLSTTVDSGLQSPADKVKINGIASGATANQTDAYLLSRANHTGTQDVSTVTGLNKSSVGLGNVDNTSDVNKPISTATQTALNTKLSTFGNGTNNYIQKVVGTNVLGNTRLFDDGTNIGIDTNTPTKDLGFGNTKDRKIGLEESSNTVIGRDLVVNAGRTINYAPSGLTKLTTTPQPYGKTTSVSGSNNVYSLISIWGEQGKQTGGVGSFEPISGVQGLNDITSYNGDLYACSDSGYYGTGLVYKKTAETGAWVSLGLPARRYSCMTITPSGDLYLGVVNGTIYKQTGLTGPLVDLNQTSRNWVSMASSVDGTVYAGISGENNQPLFKQANGTGDFVLTSFTGLNTVSSLTVTPNNNLYILNYNNNNGNGTLYYQINCQDAYYTVSLVNNVWSNGLASSSNGNVYAALDNSIYIQQNYAVGSPNLNGGTLKLAAGTGKGTGSSKIQFITGQKTASGTDMQVETVRGVIDETGLMTLPTTTNALISADATGKAVLTKEYANGNYAPANSSNTYYINSVSGSNVLGVIGDKSKPFLNVAGVFSVMPVDDGSTYTLFFQNSSSHVMTVLPNRNLNFETYNYTYQTGYEPVLDFSTIASSEIIIQTDPAPEAQYSFGQLTLSSNATRKTFRLNGEIKFNKTVVKTGGIFFIVGDAKGVIKKLERIPSHDYAFNIYASNTGDLLIQELKLIGSVPNTYLGYLLRETYSYKKITIENITGTGTYYLTNLCNNSVINIGNSSLNGTIGLGDQNLNNVVFNFLGSSFSSTTIFDIGEQQGIITGTIVDNSFTGIGAGFERGGAVLKFINFNGKLRTINKYVATAQIHFINSNIICENNLLNLVTPPSVDFIKFIGVNTFKQTTSADLILSSSSVTIEKRGANSITTNATILGANVIINNSTPNIF